MQRPDIAETQDLVYPILIEKAEVFFFKVQSLIDNEAHQPSHHAGMFKWMDPPLLATDEPDTC